MARINRTPPTIHRSHARVSKTWDTSSRREVLEEGTLGSQKKLLLELMAGLPQGTGLCGMFTPEPTLGVTARPASSRVAERIQCREKSGGVSEGGGRAGSGRWAPSGGGVLAEELGGMSLERMNEKGEGGGQRR